ncbi:hypothetical protein LOTGIDRAFT_175080 [Lottia gigantea]|uniref:Tryptophan synthase beta chain-like PALP domain-containing protein n=1 Tax=Lottia gigantea TaxID=225164 RepID=V4C2X4_LOTGI|nr:hypothetical protein LOTGIDRAFT_175080 [Lottia gigantea]ESO95839.1 hypothetical protein LOTGIDRAFT_175080 [Lottia gigantea]
MSTSHVSEILKPYHPAPWMSDLHGIPSHIVELSQKPTPIQPWNLPRVPDGYQISIKRDDMTGSTLSGNKVRKLEFLLADAIHKECQHVITIGGIQSNHCRAVAIAARQLGLTPHLFLRSEEKEEFYNGSEGNLLLDKMVGSNIYFIPKKSTYKKDCLPRMEQLAEHIQSTRGEKSYIIPVGGSNELGIFGYIEVFREMIEQESLEKFDDIVCACGSGTTLSGMAVANYLTGSKLKIHGITVCDSKKYFHDDNNEIFPLIGLKSVQSEDIVNIIDGFKGQGYGLSTEEELGTIDRTYRDLSVDFLTEVGSKTGIMLDPVYTGKAAFGLVQLLEQLPEMFKGRRILFIHTGGIFGLADGRMNVILKSKSENKIKIWNDINKPPFS